jgi:hypothetical protein
MFQGFEVSKKQVVEVSRELNIKVLRLLSFTVSEAFKV